MADITLPPLPTRSCVVTNLGADRPQSFMLNTRLGVELMHSRIGTTLHLFTADQLRDRDLEVARLVLASLADEFSDWHGAKLIVSTIRAMKVKHHE